MKEEKTVGGIEGLCVITPAVHGDARGYFMETYNEREMKEAGFDIQFVQDNQSMSVKGVLRGLHFQINYPQCKLVRAVRGSAGRFRNLWKMVWCGIVGRKQKTVPDSGRLCAWLPGPV